MVCHTGKNLNNSTFDKENIEKAMYSLEGIPIVGEYKKENNDFGGHGGKLEITEDSVEFIQTTMPYGFVPFGDLANIRFETILDKDGHTEREWLVADAYIWYKRYPEVEKLLSGNNNQSMEIEVKSYSWNDDDNCLDIKDFIFNCLCILGEDVMPAMQGAKILPYSDIRSEFQAMLKDTMQELKEVSDLKFEENKVQENVIENDVFVEKEHIDTDVTDKKDFTECQEDKNKQVNDEFEKEANDDKNDNSESHSCDCESYEVLERAYDVLKAEFEKLEDEIVKLNERIEKYESDEKNKKLEELYQEFSELSDKDISEIRSRSNELSFEEIENALYAALGRKKRQFSKKESEKETHSFKIAKDENIEVLPYGGLFEKFSK